MSRSRILATFLIAALPAVAQPPGRGQSGVSFGHIHFNSADPEKAIAFWIDVIGATDYSRGPIKGVIMAGALILFTKTPPAAPSTGAVVDRIDLHVPDLAPFTERLSKTPYKSFLPVAGGPQLMIDGPDGVRIELNEDNELYNPLEFQYLHFASPHSAEMQAWYAKLFGARSFGDDKSGVNRLSGGALVFGKADAAAPTAGRAIDHIAFEIKGLEAFCAKLAADGIKFDTPYTPMPDLKMSSAFFTDPWGTRIELTEGLSH